MFYFCLKFLGKEYYFCYVNYVLMLSDVSMMNGKEGKFFFVDEFFFVIIDNSC